MAEADMFFYHTVQTHELVCMTDVEKMKLKNPSLEENFYTCRYYVPGNSPMYGEWTESNSGTVRLRRGVVWEMGTKSVIFVDEGVNIQIYFEDNDYLYVGAIICQNIDKFSCNITYSSGYPSATFYQNHVTVMNFLRDRIEICGGVNGNMNITITDLMEFPLFSELEKLPLQTNIEAIEAFNTAISLPRFRSYFTELQKLVAPKPIVQYMPAKETDDKNSICKICTTNVANYIMTPCGHRICCTVCYGSITTDHREYFHKCLGCNVDSFRNELIEMH